MSRRQYSLIIYLLLSSSLLSLLLPGVWWNTFLPAYAATITVTSSADNNTGVCPSASNCTLRAALAAAAPGDTINFQSGLASPITLSVGTLTIGQNLTIQGPGAGLLAIDGNNVNIVFTINAGVISVTGLTIQDGNAGLGSGGGIYMSNATLNLTSSTVSANSARFGGGIYLSASTLNADSNTFSSNSASWNGGAIDNDLNSNLTVTNSTFTGNSAGGDGGAIENYNSSLTLNSVTFSNNSASAGKGGAFFTYGNWNYSNTSFSGNHASYGGDIYNSSTGSTPSSGTTSGNTNAPNSSVAPANPFNFVGRIAGTMSRQGASGGYAVVSGGSIYNAAGVTMYVSNYSISNYMASYGGAIYNNGTLNIYGMTFSNNQVAGSGDTGGAIENSSTGTLNMANTTLYGNAAFEGTGGGIHNSGTLTISNSTLSGNSATGNGGSIFNANVLNLGSTIIANGTAGAGPDISGTVTSLGDNLIGSTGGATGFISSDQQNVPALLNPLADNGGPTQTMSLKPSSQAIGKGNCNLGSPAAPVSTDQRGVARKTPCDVGAYETFGTDKIGIYNTADGQFYLSKDNVAILSHFVWGPGTPWVAISGDWDGNGSDTIGIYNTTDGEFYLSNNNAAIASHFVWGPGTPWVPIVGDWNGDGVETIGIYNTADGEFYLSNNNSTIASHFVWGPGGTWKAIVGDWDGNGTDTIGLYNTADGEFYTTNNNAAIASHFVWGPGTPWVAITGDWDGNGTETIGIYNTADGEFYLTNNNSTIASHFVWGPGGTWTALAGKWTGTTLPSQPSQSQAQPTPQPAPTFVPRR